MVQPGDSSIHWLWAAQQCESDVKVSPICLKHPIVAGCTVSSKFKLQCQQMELTEKYTLKIIFNLFKTTLCWIQKTSCWRDNWSSMELMCGAPLYYIQCLQNRAQKLAELKLSKLSKPAPIACCAVWVCGLRYYNYIITNVARGSCVLPYH